MSTVLSRSLCAGLLLSVLLGGLLACTRPEQADVGMLPFDMTVTPEDAAAVTPPIAVTPGPPITPTPLVPRQVPETLTVFHTVVSGETLFSIALQYDTTVDALMTLNGIANPNQLAVGQVLQVSQTPAQTGPGERLLPDSELVYGPAYAAFDVRAATAGCGGWFNQYGEEVEGRWYSAPELVELVARQYSVGPRVLLALLEVRGGWLTNPDPTPEARLYPLGYAHENWDGLYAQLLWAANALNAGFYGWLDESLWVLQLDDGQYVQLSPFLNAGTVGVQRALSAGLDFDAWTLLLALENEQGFLAVYRELFGDPFAYAVEPLLPPDMVAPTLALPWSRGETWYFTGGPHGGWDSGSAWAALDFVPGNEQLGCAPSPEWATAVAPGTVVYSDNGMVLLDLDDDHFFGTGWVMVYLHLATAGRVAVGTALDTGEQIGHPSCEGGVSNATHLHFARRYNGVWIAAAHPRWPLVLDGWQAASTGVAYDGTLTRGDQVRTACECWEPLNAIQHTGP